MNMTTLDTAAHITITAEDVPQHIVGMTWSMRGREVIANSSPEANWGEYIEVKNQDDLNKWKKEDEEFSLSIKEGKLIADAQVASKLFHRAIGTTITKEVQVGNSDVKLELKQDIPGDVRAMEFWLKNRQPTKWRDLKQTDLHVGVSKIPKHLFSDEDGT